MCFLLCIFYNKTDRAEVPYHLRTKEKEAWKQHASYAKKYTITKRTRWIKKTILLHSLFL
jgi:hypothetical protein